MEHDLCTQPHHPSRTSLATTTTDQHHLKAIRSIPVLVSYTVSQQLIVYHISKKDEMAPKLMRKDKELFLVQEPVSSRSHTHKKPSTLPQCHKKPSIAQFLVLRKLSIETRFVSIDSFLSCAFTSELVKFTSHYEPSRLESSASQQGW